MTQFHFFHQRLLRSNGLNICGIVKCKYNPQYCNKETLKKTVLINNTRLQLSSVEYSGWKKQILIFAFFSCFQNDEEVAEAFAVYCVFGGQIVQSDVISFDKASKLINAFYVLSEEPLKVS